MKDLSALQIRTMRPGSRSVSPISSLRLAFQEAWQSRYVIWQLFKRDFAAQFQQRLLGYLWIMLGPIVGIASFLFMSFTGILQPGPIGLPYIIFALSGSIFWGVLVSSVNALSGALVGQSDLITRTNIPKVALALASASNLIYAQIINFFILLIVCLLNKTLPSPWMMLYPLLTAPLFFLGLGIGFILSIVNVIARDISSAFNMILQLLMYLCPVAYMPNFHDGKLLWITKHNPLFYLIQFPRTVIFFGNFQNYQEFLASSLLCFCIFVLGIHGFYLIEDKVAERL